MGEKKLLRVMIATFGVIAVVMTIFILQQQYRLPEGDDIVWRGYVTNDLCAAIPEDPNPQCSYKVNLGGKEINLVTQKKLRDGQLIEFSGKYNAEQNTVNTNAVKILTSGQD